MSEIIDRVARALDKSGQERGHRIPPTAMRHLAVAAIDALDTYRAEQTADEINGLRKEVTILRVANAQLRDKAALYDSTSKLNHHRAKVIERLRKALGPFALNPGAVSLSKALGHISREHLLAARDALSPSSTTCAPSEIVEGS